MILCGCTGATDRDVRDGTPRGRAAGRQCGGCRPALKPFQRERIRRNIGADEPAFDGKHVVARLDGRVELTCRHGVGHPSRLLQERRGRRRWGTHDGTHGCDGCCGDPTFVQAEAAVLARMPDRVTDSVID